MAIQADSNPPSYVSTDSEKRDKNPDSSSTPYCTHGTSQTPHLDGYLQQPETKAALQALITALDSIADEKQCTTCAVEASSGILTRHVHGIRAARKSAQWSKEDKKALKAEVKRFKGLKKTNVKATWRGH